MATSSSTEGVVILSSATATPQDIKNAALSRFETLRNQYIKDGAPLYTAEKRAAAAADAVFGMHFTDTIPQLPPAPDAPAEPQAQATQTTSASTDTPIYDRYVRSQFQTGPTPLYDTYVGGSGFSGPRTPLYNRYVGEGRVPDSIEAMRQRPDFPIHFPEEEHAGPFAGTVQMVALTLKNTLKGASNLLLGPPIPSAFTGARFLGMASESAISQQLGPTALNLTPEQMADNRMAAAFVASSLVGGVTASTILAGMSKGVVKNTLTSTAVGATFGALRPKDQKESLLGAIATDAILFGGLSLAGGLIGKITRPIKVGADALEGAGVQIDPKILRSAPEYGKSIFEEVQGVSDLLRSGDMARVPDIALEGLEATVAQVPSNIGVLRRYFGSPSLWKNVGGVVGDAAERIVDNAGQRMGIALRERGAWDTILSEAERLITKDIPPSILMGEGAGMRAALVQQRKEAFGKLLDNVFQPTDLPVTVPPNMVRAFEIVRNRLLADREALKLLVGGTADWGIDAYLPHVFVGDWAVLDAATKAIYKIVKVGDIRSAAAEVLTKNPNAALRIVPKQFIMPAELAGLGLTGKQLGTFISRASQALAVDRDEIASVLFENKVVRVKPNKKWFGHAQARGDPALEGFESDPFTALRIYAAGATRKIAFHDFEQKATAIVEELMRTPGTKTSADALKVYMDRVLGRPSELETAVRTTLQEIARRGARPFGPGVQQFAEEVADPRVLLGKVNQFEAMSRLGYSPVAWYTNLTQTLVNTSSAIGWGPTMRGIRLFLDRTQTAQVDALMRALDIDLAVPLTAADQIVTRNIGQVSPFHPLYLFNKIETANRAIAALAKYQEQILKGADIRQALDEARQFVRQTQFDYSLADAPRLLQGPLGAGVFQFKKFLLKEMEFMWSIRGNPAALARFTTNVWAVGGASALFALPPLILLDWAVGELTGERLSERLQAAFPRASRGPLGFAGVDMGGNIAIGLPRETGDVFGPGVNDLFTLARDLVGKPTLDLVRGKQGHLTPGDRAQAVATLVPVMVRRLMDSYDILESGVVRARGTTQLKFHPDNVQREAVLAAFGFRSLARAEEQRVITTIRREVDQHKSDEQAVVQAWASHYVAGEMEDATRVLQDAQADGLLITREQLRDALAATILERSTRAVRGAPKELRLRELQRLQQIRP